MTKIHLYHIKTLRYNPPFACLSYNSDVNGTCIGTEDTSNSTTLTDRTEELTEFERRGTENYLYLKRHEEEKDKMDKKGDVMLHR